MPILVGDPIVAMRAAGPDPCGVLPAPQQPFVNQAVTPGGLNAAPFYTVITYLTAWGETLPSSEGEVILTGATPAALVSIPSLPPGVNGARVYWTQNGPGTEQMYQQFDLTSYAPGAGSVPMLISSYAMASAGIPTTKSSAYLPDTDGSYVSAAIAYSWLNKALAKLGVQLGGMRDVSGVAWPSGAAWAILQNRWTEIENLWWSGWFQQVGRQEYTWLQSPVTSVPGYSTHWSNAGRDMIGLWPQPGSGPGTSTLSANVGLNDTSIAVASVGAFTMPGMFQIDSELILASTPDQTGTQMLGLIRGAGGSLAATHNSGATITQMIAMFSGTRLAPQFTPGSANMLMQLPAGWEVPLDRYMLARYREKEQLLQEAQALDNEFTQWVESLRTSKDAVPKDRATGDGRVYNAFLGFQSSGALPFGILVP